MTDHDFEVRGGANSRAARLEDLSRFASVTSRAAHLVASVTDDVARLRASGDTEFATIAGPTGFGGWPAEVEQLIVREARHRLVEIAGGPSGLARTSQRLVDLSAHATITARAYVFADQVAATAFDAVMWSSGLFAGELSRALLPPPLGVAAVGGAPGGRLVGPFAGASVASMLLGATAMTGRPAAVEAAAAVVPGVISGATPVRTNNVAELVAAALVLSPLTPWLHETRKISMLTRLQPLRGKVPTNPRPPDGVASLVALLGVAEDGERSVVVERITAPDGRRSWVVAVPGVQTWDPVATQNPYDVTGAVHAMARQRPAAAAHVVSAMEAAGVRAGEPVLLAGHSFGGMVVAGLAADPSFTSRYRVTHVLTAGSPVAHFAVPAQIRVLSLEHQEDVVPALDGRRNPERSRWITLRSSARTTPKSQGTSVGGFSGHDLGSYRRTAQRADGAGPALLDGWAQGFEAYAVSQAEVRVWRFGGRR